jgi:magnesium-dependent phosphatase 1
MFALWVLLPVGLQLSMAGVTFADKVRAACVQLGIESSGVPVTVALQECNEAVGLPQVGALMMQADQLVAQLGLTFEEPARPARAKKSKRPPDPSLPELVVFDLDFTLWQPELYQLSSGPPFKACKDGSVITARGERLDLFPAARGALAELADAGVPVAIASRASEVGWALEIMRLLRVDKKRTMADVIGNAPVVIQGGSKVKHLKHIASETGVALENMVFFDNERSNIAEVERIGPTCVYCPRGMKDGLFRDGLALHLGTTSSGRRRNNKEEPATGEGGVDSKAGRGRRGGGGAGGRRGVPDKMNKKSRGRQGRGGRR